ncbi:MAG TPA: class I tRNA ligase family protein, partial [Chitinophagaceae bacterium]|nr:class I tRNA ligase family protein [Chitinophagaceae bacterium]
KIKIHPEERFLATYKYWLENVKDWCISRQLWWGQRIPAWYDEAGNLYVAETLQQLHNQKPEIKNQKLSQDEDVLDTWFSSWLWPVEVFKGITHPGNEDIKYYYPTSVLVTGQDIIFFWVARMIMAGMEYMNKKPFSDVYFTGMVRDKQGRKMSKSLGNSPDLLDLIDKYGADAVRFGITISSPAGNDLLFDEASLGQGRNFNNKLWNALKLVRSWESRVGSRESGENFAVEWFENRLNEIKAEIEKMFTEFRLSEALKTIYSLIWDDFCSWYLEWVKPEFGKPIDKNVYNKTVEFFDELLQLLHPFMPFITEEIYYQLDSKRNEDLCLKQSSELMSIKRNDGIRLTEISMKLIEAIRNFRNIKKIKKEDPITIYHDDFPYSSSGLNNRIEREKAIISDVKIRGNLEDQKLILNVETVLIESYKFYFDLGHLGKSFKEAIKNKLLSELEYRRGFLLSVEKKLNNERFVQNAKPEIIETERKKKADTEAKIKAIEESLAGLA